MSNNLTRKDIAEAAGVSPSTVSRALSGSKLLPESTIEHVRKIAQELGYRPNILARRLAANKSFQIGFVVPLSDARKGVFQSSYYSNILDSMVTTSFKYNYSISIHPYQANSSGSIQEFVDMVTGKEVDGLVFIGLTQRSKIPSALAKAKIPFVLIGSNSNLKKVFSVNCEPEPGLREMLKTLLDKGYKRMFYVQGDQAYYDAVIQKKLLLDIIKEYNAFESVELLEGNYTRTSGYKAAASIIPGRKKGDCVFLANDRMAMGFYRYCYEHEIHIPSEIAVIGSDHDEAGTALYPDLTTIRQPRKEMGEAAVELLIDILNSKKVSSVKVPKKFLLGQSI